MLISKDNFPAAYADIRDGARRLDGGGVLLLAAPEADALCAARMLTTLFRTDSIEYVLTPVAGYSDIQKAIFNAGDSLGTIIMINCGGNIDLSELLVEKVDSLIYIIDSHRPYHHKNINNISTLVVLDWDGDRSDIPEDGDSDIEEGEDFDPNENFDEVGDQDDDIEKTQDGDNAGSHYNDPLDGSGLVGTPTREAASNPESNSSLIDNPENVDSPDSGSKRSHDDSDSFEDDDDDDDGKGAKRLRRAQDDSKDKKDSNNSYKAPLISQRQLERNLRKRNMEAYYRIREYYRYNRFGHPASFVVFEMIDRLNRTRNDYLWLACVGITAPFLNERISREAYNELYSFLSRPIAARNEYNSSTTESSESNGFSASGTREGRIELVDSEPRFFLHRHWSLYDSMRFSEFVSSRLGLDLPNSSVTYTGGSQNSAGLLRAASASGSSHGLTFSRQIQTHETMGSSMLEKLLVRTGTSTKIAQQSYVHMTRDQRQSFFSKLVDTLQDDFWGLAVEQLFYPSFVRHVASEPTISAADVVISLTGLLSASTLTSTTQSVAAGVFGSPNSSNNNTTNNSNGPSTSANVGGSLRNWKDSFIYAFESLSRTDREKFEIGLERSKVLRKAIAHTAQLLIRTGHVHSGRNVRWIEVDTNIHESERALFHEPLALRELASMVIRLHRDSMLKWRLKSGAVDTKPVIITLRNVSTSVGVTNAQGNLASSGEAVTDLTTVMGVSVTAADGEAAYSNFLEAFQKAAERTAAVWISDSFDSSTLVISSAHVPDFMAALDPAVAN